MLGPAAGQRRAMPPADNSVSAMQTRLGIAASQPASHAGGLGLAGAVPPVICAKVWEAI